MPITVRKSADRGQAMNGGVKAQYTFSFGTYTDNKYMGFRTLRILNEDIIGPSKGFPTHQHSEMEIFTYVVSGVIEHQDSMGNVEQIQRGGVQFTSAGKGMSHSEFNASPHKPLHLLQMWVSPNQSLLEPSYQTKIFGDEQKRGKLCLIVSPDGKDGSISIHQDIKMFASILKKGENTAYKFAKKRHGYIHVVDSKAASITINDDIVLNGGDGAFISGEYDVDIASAGDKSEFVFFDLN